MKIFTEEQVLELLEIQRGNCYVAVLTKCRDIEIATAAANAPIPGGEQFNQFHKGIDTNSDEFLKLLKQQTNELV